MPRYNEYVVEKVAEAMCDADATSWKHSFEDGAEYTTFTDVAWSDMMDDTVIVPYEGISLGRDHYRTMARAALAAIDSLYESEAEEPVEYAGIEGGL